MDLAINRSFADDRNQLFGGDAVGVVEVLHGEVVVELREFVEHLVAVLGGLLHHILGDVVSLIGHALVLVAPHVSLHLEQVDDAGELVLGSDGNGEDDGVAVEFLFDLADGGVEVSAGAVHLVDVADTGHVVFVGLAPHRFRLGLHAAYGAENGDGPVENAEGAFHFHRKVHVAGGVDDVDFILLVEVFP